MESNEVKINPWDLPMKWYCQRWPQLRNIEDNPIFRQWAFRKNRHHLNLNWQTIILIITRVLLFIFLIIFLNILGLILYILLSKLLDGFYPKRFQYMNLFNTPNEQLVRDMQLTLLNPEEIAFGVMAANLSKRAFIKICGMIGLTLICYVCFLISNQASITFTLSSNVTILLISYIVLKNIDIFTITSLHGKIKTFGINQFFPMDKKARYHVVSLCATLLIGFAVIITLGMLTFGLAYIIESIHNIDIQRILYELLFNVTIIAGSFGIIYFAKKRSKKTVLEMYHYYKQCLEAIASREYQLNG